MAKVVDYTIDWDGSKITVTNITQSPPSPYMRYLVNGAISEQGTVSTLSHDYSEEEAETVLSRKYGFEIQITETIDGASVMSKVAFEYVLLATDVPGVYTFAFKQTILELAKGVVGGEDIDAEAFAVFKNKWLTLLGPSLNIPVYNTYNEFKWPYEALLLIAYLVIRDMVYASLNATTLGQSKYGLSSIGSGMSQSSSGVIQGAVKKIETGPTSVERFDAAASYSESAKATSAMYQSLFQKDGLWEDIIMQICNLANRLGLIISGCNPNIKVPVKVVRASDYSYQDQYPITPATQPRPLE